jgi:hypothetical protein
MELGDIAYFVAYNNSPAFQKFEWTRFYVISGLSAVALGYGIYIVMTAEGNQYPKVDGL